MRPSKVFLLRHHGGLLPPLTVFPIRDDPRPAIQSAVNARPSSEPARPRINALATAPNLARSVVAAVVVSGREPVAEGS